MFAWILKTKPLNSSRDGSIGPMSEARARGGGMSSEKVSRKASRPKLLIALPKNIGETCPASKRSRSKRVARRLEQLGVVAELLVAHRVELLPERRVVEPGTSTGGLSAPVSELELARSASNRYTRCRRRWYTPRKRRRRKMGQVTG